MNAEQRRDDLLAWGCDEAGYLLHNPATGMYVLIHNDRVRWLPAELFDQIMNAKATPVYADGTPVPTENK